MDRVSDKELWALIQVAGKHPNYLLHEKFWDTIVSAFTELRERRGADKIANIKAEIDNTICQICERRHDIGNPCYRIK